MGSNIVTFAIGCHMIEATEFKNPQFATTGISPSILFFFPPVVGIIESEVEFLRFVILYLPK